MNHPLLRSAEQALTKPLLGCALLLAVVAGAVAQPMQIEPTVSTKEAKLLTEAAATTNLLEAIALLQIKDLPKASAALDFAIGNFQFQTEQHAAAVTSYQHAIEKLPMFRNARKNLGRVYLLLEQDDNAIRVYQSLVEDGLVDADALLLLGHGLIRQSHYVSAENAYRQVLLLAVDNQDAQQGLAKCLLQQQRYQEARSLLKTILATTPKRAELWSLLANVNMALDAQDDAICSLETAKRLDLATAPMLGLLGDLYLNRTQPTDAVTQYEAALTAGWNQPQRLLRAVEGLIQLGDATGATRMLNRMTNAMDASHTDQTTPPDWAHDHLRLTAELAALEGRTAEAIAHYRELIKQDPLHGKALIRLGDLLIAENDLGAAELAYERAGRLEGMQTEALIRRAQLAVQRSQYTEAVTLLERAQGLKPQPHVARYLEQVRRLAEQ